MSMANGMRALGTLNRAMKSAVFSASSSDYRAIFIVM
jgi:hypothetical protein